MWMYNRYQLTFKFTSSDSTDIKDLYSVKNVVLGVQEISSRDNENSYVVKIVSFFSKCLQGDTDFKFM